MIDALKRRLGLRLSRWHFRHREDTVITFTQSVTEARNALLIVPFDRVEPAPIASVIDILRARFQEKHITVVTPLHSVELMRLLPQGRFIKMDETERTPLYLPRPSLLQRMPRNDYDVAIDLNLDFVLPSGYICRESNARVRIGFAGASADLFYNFLVQTAPNLGRQQMYERLAACLAMF